MMVDFSLNDLEAIIATRASVKDGTSYTASLVTQGMARATKKFGEEAVETIIAALSGERDDLINESADVLYHLLVVWQIAGLTLNDVLTVLQQRTVQSGLEEKASRGNNF